MNLSRTFFATVATVSVLAAIGCSSKQPAPEVAAAPMAVPAAPPEQVAAADTMASRPAMQTERSSDVVVSQDAPVVVAKAPDMAAPASTFVERAPQPDRN